MDPLGLVGSPSKNMLRRPREKQATPNRGKRQVGGASCLQLDSGEWLVFHKERASLGESAGLRRSKESKGEGQADPGESGHRTLVRVGCRLGV